jgi:hypothetical protein
MTQKAIFDRQGVVEMQPHYGDDEREQSKAVDCVVIIPAIDEDAPMVDGEILLGTNADRQLRDLVDGQHVRVVISVKEGSG